ncbi:MAG: NAD(P)H-dependent glycerol-3-phosphate dehydrogenase, partial [Candidatus Limnocylindrales bacterium]
AARSSAARRSGRARGRAAAVARGLASRAEADGLMAGPRVAVVGAGAWGTTLARVLARSEAVTLLCHSPETAARIRETGRNEARLPGVDLPATVTATADPAVLTDAADLVVFAVPSAHLRAMVETVAPFLGSEADLLSVVKGLEQGTLLRMSLVIAEAAGVPVGRIAALSGPNLAAEVARNLPASAVVAAGDLDLAERVVARLARRRFRLYVNEDILGVELCGATKNVVAIAAGAADGLGFGDNGKAGLLTRGLAEMTRLGIAAGANPLTFAGLAGMGDLIATCGSHLSRNHRLGEELAKGRPWAEIEATLPGVAEGAYTVRAALALAERYGVEMPIAREVERALFEGKSVQRCLVDLLARESKDELADYGRWMARIEEGTPRV